MDLEKLFKFIRKVRFSEASRKETTVNPQEFCPKVRLEPELGEGDQRSCLGAEAVGGLRTGNRWEREGLRRTVKSKWDAQWFTQMAAMLPVLVICVHSQSSAQHFTV
ncbi:uncharacterized protein LOC143689561 isoform X2 [Tamandua tetradactyla]|uniref:uncharacterized protein LOC143689561 isoform X2 n=1 Tax=Tamandua tetradactyla TaxID=48850 RepID=UPI00405480E4